VLNLYDGLVDVSKIDIEMGMQEHRHPRYAPRYGVKVLINQFNGLAYDVFVHRFAPLLITSVLAGDLLSLVPLAKQTYMEFQAIAFNFIVESLLFFAARSAKKRRNLGRIKFGVPTGGEDGVLGFWIRRRGPSTSRVLAAACSRGDPA